MAGIVKKIVSKLIVVVFLAVGAVIGFAFHAWLSPTPRQQEQAKGGKSSDARAEVAFWTCSMHPQIREPGPGRCPICSTELIPVKTGEEPERGAGGMRQFRTSAEGKALMEIETRPVERRFVTAEVRMVGKVTYDETRVGYITAWVGGRLDRLYVDYTGVEVEKDDHMVYIYSPELLSAQEELIQSLKVVRELSASDVSIIKETAEATVVAAREKLRLLGLKPEQIRKVEERGTPTDHVTIYAPMGGTVIHKNAQEGMYVQTGTRIYTIADLSHLWVLMDAYESDLEWLRYGQKVEFSTEGYPGENFTGRIAFIDPVVDPRTRTVKVRVNVPNPEGKLKPEMFVRAVVRANVARGGRVMQPELAGKWICPFHPEVVRESPGACDVCGMDLVTTESQGYVPVKEAESAKPLVIPVSAALVTGRRAVVYVEVPDAEKPTFEGREIVLGPRAGDYYIVRHGLSEGELVVAKGNFNIDSALQIQAKPSMMTPEGGGGGGHRHGEEPQKATDAATPQKMDVPPTVQDQLRRVERAYEALSTAMRAEDLGQANAAFAELGHAVDRVGGELLTGHARMVWNELAMLLGNDAFEGKEATKLEEADAIFALLERHVQRMRDQFGLAHEHMAMPEPAETEAPLEFQRQLASVWATYRKLHAALAADDKEAAIAASEDMRKALAAVDMTVLDHRAHMAWTPIQQRMQAGTQETAAAGDLEGIRAGLPAISEALREAMQTFGIEPAGPVYKLRCPMAFDGQGAIWLQGDRQTRNPYLGAAMPKCGDVVETMVIKSMPTGSAHDHE